MAKRRKKSKIIQHILLSLLGAALVSYFIYHTIQGDRGWFAMLRLSNEIKAAESTLTGLQKERQQLENRTQLLRDQSMDPDLFDEKSRELLNYSKPNEIIILTPHDEPKSSDQTH